MKKLNTSVGQLVGKHLTVRMEGQGAFQEAAGQAIWIERPVLSPTLMPVYHGRYGERGKDKGGVYEQSLSLVMNLLSGIGHHLPLPAQRPIQSIRPFAIHTFWMMNLCLSSLSRVLLACGDAGRRQGVVSAHGTTTVLLCTIRYSSSLRAVTARR